jgi:hypothetical protein
LIAFLCSCCPCRGVGRQPIYVDLEAEPKIDKDNPPDLKQYADSIEPPAKADDSTSGSTQTAAAGAAAGAAAAGGAKAAAAGGSSKPSKKAAGSSSSKGAPQQSNDAKHIELTNVVNRTADIVDMVGVC